jgi:hypothetical protein
VKRSVINETGGYDENEVLRRICDWDLWSRIGRKHRVRLIDSMVGVTFHGYRDSLAKTSEISYEAFRTVRRGKVRKIRLQGEMVKGSVVPENVEPNYRVELDGIEFDEDAYLMSNPDVRDALMARIVSSGWDHYVKYGCREVGHRGVTKELNDLVRRVVETLIG